MESVEAPKIVVDTDRISVSKTLLSPPSVKFISFRSLLVTSSTSAAFQA
jgi:hypothetical protein